MGLTVPQRFDFNTSGNYNVSGSSDGTHVPAFFDQEQGKLNIVPPCSVHDAVLVHFKHDSGECFTMKNRTEEKIDNKREWAAPELKKINVEEVTSYIFKLGDDDDDTFTDS
jgi:hypothetical protein